MALGITFQEGEPDWTDTMQVCLNGHLITTCSKKYPHYKRDYCSDCGEKTITTCPNPDCKKPIPGYRHLAGVVSSVKMPIPPYCPSCGKPFPWTEKKAVEPQKEAATKSNNIFVVHGHDEGMKNAMARALDQLELIPVILAEQPDEGKTVIEKFEKHADVGFAVILLSPDDLAYKKSENHKDAKPRARQNVILELGYFVGRLGRNKVMALIKGNIEQPSDIIGIVYTTFDDAEGWHKRLVRELRAAGYDVDANKLI